jgi:hypothetical protein
MCRIRSDKKKELEKLLIETWRGTKGGKLFRNSEEEIIITAITETVAFFSMADHLEGSGHAEVIKKLYLTGGAGRGASRGGKKKRVFQKTREGLAAELHMGSRTLDRYTDKYIKCFERNLQIIRERISAGSSAPPSDRTE